jgi:hypothetical protein
MLDHSSNNTTKIQVIPDAALSLPPRRVELPGYALWLRPSDVLRIETRTQRYMGYGLGVSLYFSDGREVFLPDAGADVADNVAALLWESAA